MVVAIIAIIAAIGVAIFQDMTRKARLSADQDTVANLRSAVALYDAKTNGVLPREPRVYQHAHHAHALLPVRGQALLRQEQWEAHLHGDHRRLPVASPDAV